jgi:hypothetical protein
MTIIENGPCGEFPAKFSVEVLVTERDATMNLGLADRRLGDPQNSP